MLVRFCIFFMLLVTAIHVGRWSIELVDSAYSKFPVFSIVGKIFEPEYEWEETKPSPENDAKEFVLSIMKEAAHSYGAKTVQGIPIYFNGPIEKRDVRTKFGRETVRVNLLKEMQEKNLQILFARFVSTTDSERIVGHKFIQMKAIAIRHDQDPTASFMSMFDTAIQVEFDTSNSKKWKPLKIFVTTFGNSYLRASKYFEKSQVDQESVGTIYLSRFAYENKTFSAFLNYDNPTSRDKHYFYNIRNL